jgi:hypothetical protein
MPFSEQSDYNAQRAGVTTAIVMSIMVPIVIAGACLVCWIKDYAKRKVKKKQLV